MHPSPMHRWRLYSSAHIFTLALTCSLRLVHLKLLVVKGQGQTDQIEQVAVVIIEREVEPVGHYWHS